MILKIKADTMICFAMWFLFKFGFGPEKLKVD